MRDVKRIPRIIKKLEKLWKKNPELRLGQLIYFYITRIELVDFFYVSDESVEKEIDNNLKQ